MKLIESKTLSTTQANIEFTSIPQTYTDLILVISARSSFNSADCDLVTMRFNGATSGYSGRRLYGIPPSTVGSDGNSGGGAFLAIGPISAALNTSNTFGSTQAYIPNYTSSTSKSSSSESVQETNATAAQMEIYAGLSNVTTGITTITLGLQNGGSYVAGSMASLYGVLKGSDGLVTVS